QYIDSFGNGTTTIPMIGNKIRDSDLTLEDELKISIYINNNKYDGQFSSLFSSVPKNSILFLVGSTGFLEVSINQANAAKKLDFKVGDIITIKL
ncbi:MAG: SAM-dependent chlorinase/fluorinase, partial [Candidatus Lokiarchaeota archaeon]|nr:SAM-dependent chlorinase/fluorinase [Candidatus Lokiarchaeota archaeon]